MLIGSLSGCAVNLPFGKDKEDSIDMEGSVDLGAVADTEMGVSQQNETVDLGTFPTGAEIKADDVIAALSLTADTVSAYGFSVNGGLDAAFVADASSTTVPFMYQMNTGETYTVDVTYTIDENAVNTADSGLDDTAMNALKSAFSVFYVNNGDDTVTIAVPSGYQEYKYEDTNDITLDILYEKSDNLMPLTDGSNVYIVQLVDRKGIEYYTLNDYAIIYSATLNAVADSLVAKDSSITDEVKTAISTNITNAVTSLFKVQQGSNMQSLSYCDELASMNVANSILNTSAFQFPDCVDVNSNIAKAYVKVSDNNYLLVTCYPMGLAKQESDMVGALANTLKDYMSESTSSIDAFKELSAEKALSLALASSTSDTLRSSIISAGANSGEVASLTNLKNFTNYLYYGDMSKYLTNETPSGDGETEESSEVVLTGEELKTKNRYEDLHPDLFKWPDTDTVYSRWVSIAGVSSVLEEGDYIGEVRDKVTGTYTYGTGTLSGASTATKPGANISGSKVNSYTLGTSFGNYLLSSNNLSSYKITGGEKTAADQITITYTTEEKEEINCILRATTKSEYASQTGFSPTYFFTPDDVDSENPNMTISLDGSPTLLTNLYDGKATKSKYKLSYTAEDGSTKSVPYMCIITLGDSYLMLQCDASGFPSTGFDVIAANITKNIGETD